MPFMKIVVPGAGFNNFWEVILAPALMREMVTIHLGVCMPELTSALTEDESKD